MTEQVVLYVALAYLLGSFPSAYVVGRLLGGVDIRRIGNGNIGARNTYRCIGRWAGICVAALDIAKGSIAVLLAKRAGLPSWWVLIVGGVAVLGHDFMLFLGFQGGQGMATSIGVLLIALPLQTLIGVCIAGFMKLILRAHFDVSFAVGLGAIPLLAWVTREPPAHVLYPIALLPVIGIRKLMCVCSAQRDSAHGSAVQNDGFRD
jgi:glycerol-3-phosphate acyltransferase PlsY